MIRAYRESDFFDVAGIYNLCKPDEFSGEDSPIIPKPLVDDEQMQELFRKSELYVYQKIKIVGFAGNFGNHITWLFVHPDYRRKYIAKNLVDFILAKLNGEVSLNVARSNIAAIRLYKSLGFELTQEFTGKYQDRPIIVWQMKLLK